MNILSKRIASAVAAGALLLNAGLPIFADTTTTITGNGAGSDNFVTNEQTSTTNVSQSNSATVDNRVTTDLDTGNNDAQFNTGGDVVIATGNARSTVDVTNALNANVAEIACCSSDDVSTKVEGNGAFSTNVVDTRVDDRKNLTQNNYADVRNDVDNDLNSGHNDASLNTGGNVAIDTGSVSSNVDISTKANANAAFIGGPGRGGSSGSSVYSAITGNGAGSDNFITNDLNKRLDVDQDNDAYVNNDVHTDADTGYNDAEFNTGGDTLIHTGNALARVGIDNLVNFNHLSADCGCTTDFNSKISGNGAGLGFYSHPDSYGSSKFLHNLDGANSINNSSTDNRYFDQNGDADLNNDTDLDLKTGKNDNSLSTSGHGSDPWIVTGNAQDNVSTRNYGNLNVLGTGVGFTFDLGSMMGYLRSHL